MFDYTTEEHRHLWDLCEGLYFDSMNGGEIYDPAYWLYVATLDDGSDESPTAIECHEYADSLECGMQRGETI